MSASSEVIMTLLKEDDYELKKMAVEKLNYLTETNWYEMTDALPELEKLAETADFSSNNLAALVCSKIYYHLQSIEDSVRFAFLAHELFDVNENSLYSDTVSGQCVEMYAALIEKEAGSEEGKAEGTKKIDNLNSEDLKVIVERTFYRCIEDDQFSQALGVAFDCANLSFVSVVISMYGDDFVRLESIYHRVLCFVDHKSELFRQVLNQIIDKLVFSDFEKYLFLFKILIKLKDYKRIAHELRTIISSMNDYYLAFQVAFDVQDAMQSSCGHIIEELKLLQDYALEEARDTQCVDTEEGSVGKMNENSMIWRHGSLCKILDGTYPTKFQLQFLIRNSREESQTLLQFAQTRSSDPVCNTAVVIANSFINYGSTCDYLFRHMHEFMSRFTNWSRFIATGSLGVIHKGNEANAMTVLDNYLPKDSVHSSRYAVGGGLFALGIINSGRCGAVVDYLFKHFTQDQSNVVRHGAALGLGMAAFGSNNETLVESLLTPIHSDEVVGEAAAISLGMIMMGSQNEYIISTLNSIAEVNEHEKTLRGIAIALPLILHGRGHQAEEHIERLTTHQNPIQRWSGMYAIGLAFCGSGSDWAVKKLLHYTVTDANDDVRRAAVISIGFVLYKYPRLCLKIIKSLVDSYNPHVRYGSAMAIGIAFAGSGDSSACKVVEFLWNDNSAFVRQGAFIASGMILIQRTGINAEYQKLTKATTITIGDKHESPVSKFGALIGLGIAYAGSGNVTIRLENYDGHENTKAIAGIFLFQQFWFWFPLSLTLSMAFSPTGVVIVDTKFRVPEIRLVCWQPDSKFAYIPIVVDKKSRQKSRSSKSMSTGINSRLKRRKMEKNQALNATAKENISSEKRDAPAQESEETEDKYTNLLNPARVVPKQIEFIVVHASLDHVPIAKTISKGGFIFVVEHNDLPGECLQYSSSYDSNQLPSESTEQTSDTYVPMPLQISDTYVPMDPPTPENSDQPPKESESGGNQ